MIARLIRWAVDNRGAVILATLVAVALGAWSLATLPIDAIPDITGPQVQINVAVPGLAAEEVERRVTVPLERVMAGQPGLGEFRSLSKSGLAQLTLLYDDGTDIMRARQLVTERLATVAADLPPGATPVLAPITTGLGEILYYTLEWQRPPAQSDHDGLAVDARTDQLMSLAETQEYVVAPMLRQVAGVAEVNSIGGLERQFLIVPDPRRLAAAGLTATELADAVAANVENAGGGAVTRGRQRLVVRTEGRVTDPAELARLPIRFGGGVLPIRVGDVASVRIGAALRTGAATVDGRETVLGTIMLLSGENSREVARRVDARLDEVRAALPPGMAITVRYDRADIVERTIATVRGNLGEGALLVSLVLLAVLGQWRAALIVALVIPIAFLIATIGMQRLGVSGNLMSLGALDFGLVVDGAIVAVEAALARLAAAPAGSVVTPEARRAIVAEAIAGVTRPVVFGIAIITLVYVPVLALGGVEGKLFRPMATTVMLALSAALLVSLTLVPALAGWLLRPMAHGETAVVRAAQRAYAPLLAATVARPLLALVPAVLLVIAAGLLFTRLGTVFTPRLDEGAITAMVYRPVGLSLEAAVAEEQQVEQRLLARFPQLTHVFSRIGTAAIASDPMPPNENDLYIFYQPRADWPTDGPRDKAALVRAIEAEALKVGAEQRFLFAQPIEMRFNEMLEGTRGDLSVKVFGDDPAVLERLGGQVRAVLAGLPGTAEAEFEVDGRTPALVLRIDHDALLRLGLGVAEVNAAIATALAGREVGVITEGMRRHGIVVRLDEAARADAAAILALPLRVGGAGGIGLVPLGRVARLEQVAAIEPMRRDNGQRRAALLVNLSGSDVEGYVARAKAALARQVPMPPGYRIEWGGQFKQLQAARARLAILVPATLLLILLLVHAALGSLRQTLVVYSGIPLALTGGVLALALRGMPFSITAAIGFIALSGIAMLNGLVLVDHLDRLKAEGMAVAQAARDGAMHRLRPVLSTALVASLGFVPMALATGAGAEVQRPLATVVIGGIVTSTMLTLLLLPSLWAWVEGRRGTRSFAEGSGGG